jgi:hemoglobin
MPPVGLTSWNRRSAAGWGGSDEPQPEGRPITKQTVADELGGADGVASAVDDLYRRLLADPTVAPWFRDVNLRRVRAHMTDFLVTALDGPEVYGGRALDVAHAGLGVTDDAFDATASHLLDALEAQQVRPELLDVVLARVATLRAVVVSS